MNKILLTNLRWLFMSLMLATGVGSAWAETYSYTFSSKQFSANGTQTLNNISWTLSGDGGYWGYDSTKGQQFGSGSSPYKSLTLSTSGISGTISSVKVNTCGASSIAGTVTINVGSTSFLCNNNTSVTLTASATTYEFTGSSSGTITISMSQTSSKALYIKSIEITYSSGSSKTDTEVTFPQESYSATYPGSFTAPTATVANASTHATISGASVTYISSNTSVATVNQTTGAITLKGVGQATITATYAGNNTYNGSTGSYTLTVTDGRAATTTSFPSSSYEAVLGESFTSPTATVSPSAATGNVTYSSNNTAVATVDANTGEVTLEGVGTTTITATYPGDTNYKGSTGTYTLTVSNSGGGSSFTWDLSTSSYSSATTDQVVWTSTFASMTYVKASGSTTGANNYIPPTRTSTRFYTGGTLTIAPESGYKIKSIVFTATTEGYATTFKGSTWTNATASVSSTTVTVTPTSGLSSVIATVGGTCGFTGVTVYYELTSSTAPDAPSLTASCTFWPNTTETASMVATIAPTTTGSYVRYTTDGTDPTTTTGTLVTTSQNLTITATTTVKAIAYVGTITSGIASATYTLGQTVNSIADFKALSTGTEARLYLDPSKNARVLHVSGSEIYVRDNTGAICLYLNTSLQNPVPQHDWHVAGWIIGKYQPYNGLPELVATSNTTTNYMAFAAPVTETPTEPVAITASDFDNKLADWVTVPELRVSISGTDTLMTAVTEDATQLKLRNAKFKIGSSGYYNKNYAYDGALIDVTGIAIPYNTSKQISPIYYSDYRPVIYVMDEQQDFNSPSANIQNATVRLVRTLSSSNWNTFAVPFAINDMEGTIRQYASVDGTTMVYTNANSIAAGVPYLVKPTTTITNPTYTDVTLTSTEAQTVTKGNYSFVAIYSPTNIYAADNTQRFLKTDGYLYYPTSETAGRLKGMRAYFIVPDGSGSVKVNPDGMETSIDDLDVLRDFKDIKVYDTSGRMVGNDLRGLPRGIYIVNGKKIVVQ